MDWVIILACMITGVICDTQGEDYWYYGRTSTESTERTSTESTKTVSYQKTGIRLVGGSYHWAGRVEVYHNGHWGTICDDDFGIEEARVICSMLGYDRFDRHGRITPYNSAAFGPGYGSIWLDDLRCSGYESDISQCGSGGWGNNNCNHNEDASVSCRYPKSGGSTNNYIENTTPEENTTAQVTDTSPWNTGVRLVGGYYQWEGTVEVYHNGRWGTICDDDFDRQDAKVICAMLGYNRYGSITAYGNARFGEGNGSILLDNVDCSGYEGDISQCRSQGWGNHDCSHREDAGVSCRYPKSAYGTADYTTYGYGNEITTSGEIGRLGHVPVRLTYGSEGWLEVYSTGWGYVCSFFGPTYSFDSLCQYLGYSRARRVQLGYGVTYSGLLSNLRCPSYTNTNGIDYCTGSDFGYRQYCSYRVYLNCESQTTEETTTIANYGSTIPFGMIGNIPIYLTNGNSGWLQVNYNGNVGYVCSALYQSASNFDSVCQHLGYSYASEASVRYSPHSNGILSNLDCPKYNTKGNGLQYCYGGFYRYPTYCSYRLHLTCDSITTTYETYTVDTNGCKSAQPADVVFVVDESGSVGSYNFGTTKQSIVDTIRNLDIRSDQVRVGVMTFDDSTRTIFDLNTFTRDPYDMENRVRSMSYSGGGTDIANATSAACNIMFTSYHGDRTNAQNYLILLTDGQSDRSAAQRAADSCKAAGTRIISVGIGDSIDESMLRNMAYSYEYYLSTNYSDIASFLPQLVTTAVQCGGLETTDAKHISVHCQHSNWYVKVFLPALEQKYSDFKDGDIYLGTDSCTGYRNGDYLVFSEEFSTCGTIKSTNGGKLTYKNTLIYAVHDTNYHYIVKEYRFNISVSCDMSNSESGESNINSHHGGLEQQTIGGAGHFAVQLKFYSDSKYQHEFSGFPPSYMVGQNVYVKAVTPIHDYNVKMRLSECHSKPSKDASDMYTYYLIKNGCPAESNAFITSQTTHETRFYFQDFEYAFHPNSMYVHCNATFCRANDYSRECEPRCSHRKRISADSDSTLDDVEESENSTVTDDVVDYGAIGYAEDEAVVKYTKGPYVMSQENQIVGESLQQSGKPLYVGIAVVGGVTMLGTLVAMTMYFRYKRRQFGKANTV